MIKIKSTEKIVKITTQLPTKVEFNLLENGLDFISSSLEQISDTQYSNQNIKYALLHIWSGILLILKEKIAQEHWSLLFAQQNKISLKAFENGDFQSINFEQIKQLLVDVCQISIDQTHLSNLEVLKKKRNLIEHFKFDENINSARITIAHALDFAVDFIETNLNEKNFNASEGAFFDSIKDNLINFNEFVKKRMVRIQPKIKSYKGVLAYCLRCEQETAIKSENRESYKCLLCGEKKMPQFDLIAELYLDKKLGIDTYRTTKDGGDYPLYECLECETKAMIPIDSEYSRYNCFGCDTSWASSEVEFCSRCNSIMNADEMSICKPCMDYATRD